MSAHQTVRMAELENQAFALMGRLHVALRRETGRITDVEYMRSDPGYCRYLIQLALQSGNPEVQKIGERLDAIYFGEAGLFMLELPRQPLLARVIMQKPVPAPPAPPTPEAGSAQPQDSQHYVGRLR